MLVSLNRYDTDIGVPLPLLSHQLSAFPNRQNGARAGGVGKETPRVSATDFCNKANARNGATAGPFSAYFCD